jgi:protein TonB
MEGGAMPKGVPSLGPGAVSLSAAVHAAVVGGVLLVATLGRAPGPDTATAEAPRGPMVLDVTRPSGGRRSQGAPRPEGARRPASEPPANTSSASRRPAPPDLSSITTVELAVDPGDLLSGEPWGGCTTGCGVGTGEPGDSTSTEAVGRGGSGFPHVVVLGGDVRPPIKVKDVAPVYPDLAIRIRLEGKVEITCRIDAAGRVVDATVLRGHPILVPAALEAVRQWVYEPTLLNGVPVSVIMTVTVHFRLRG